MGLRATIINYNPINSIRQNCERKRLKRNITIFASNCMGGLLYHDLGQKFMSPTVNTRFDSPDFVKFICNIEYYLGLKLNFIDAPESFPVAMLDDVKVYFVHYLTIDEAEKKWKERIKRIDWNNVFVITTDNDGITDADMTALDKCKFKNVMMLTSRHLPQYRCAFELLQFKGLPEVGNTMIKSVFTGKMAVQDEVDFTGWFNQEEGEYLGNYRKHKSSIKDFFYYFYLLCGHVMNLVLQLYFFLRDKITPPTERTVLFVAHPDDDTLFFHTYIKEKKPYVVLLTTGWSIRRYIDFIKAMKYYGLKYRAYNLKSRDKRFDLLCNKIKAVFNAGHFEECATHNATGEYGHDMHQKVHNAVLKHATIPVYCPLDASKIKNNPISIKELEEKKQIFKTIYVTESWVVDEYKVWVENEKLEKVN